MTEKTMCWRCGNAGGFHFRMLEEEMVAVAKAYVKKEGQRDYRKGLCEAGRPEELS